MRQVDRPSEKHLIASCSYIYPLRIESFDASKMPPVLLHLHIPRTGGSSLNLALQSGFAEESLYNYTGLKEFFVDVAFGPRGKEVRCVTGHFHYGLHEYFEDSIYLIVLRDPVHRVRSLYSYIKRNPNHRIHQLLNEHVGNVSHFLSAVGDVSSQFSNGQVRQLNWFHRAGLRRMGERHLKEAKRHLSAENCIVAFSEDLDQLVANLGALYDVAFSPVGRINGSDCIEMDRDERIDDLIRSQNELDMELYRWARKNFPASNEPAAAIRIKRWLASKILRQSTSQAAH